MKIDRKRLEAIIKEEILKLYEINPAHDNNGRWAKKGKGKVYSLTANAVDNLGDDSEFEAPARGRVSQRKRHALVRTIQIIIGIIKMKRKKGI